MGRGQGLGGERERTAGQEPSLPASEPERWSHKSLEGLGPKEVRTMTLTFPKVQHPSPHPRREAALRSIRYRLGLGVRKNEEAGSFFAPWPPRPPSS